jgi:hypothetical protein
MSLVYRLDKQAPKEDRKAMKLFMQSMLDSNEFNLLVQEWLAALPATVKTQALNRCEGGIGGDSNRNDRQIRFSDDFNWQPDHMYPRRRTTSINLDLLEPDVACDVAGNSLCWETCANALLTVLERRLQGHGANPACLVMRIRLPKPRTRKPNSEAKSTTSRSHKRKAS